MEITEIFWRKKNEITEDTNYKMYHSTVYKLFIDGQLRINRFTGFYGEIVNRLRMRYAPIADTCTGLWS